MAESSFGRDSCKRARLTRFTGPTPIKKDRLAQKTVIRTKKHKNILKRCSHCTTVGQAKAFEKGDRPRPPLWAATAGSPSLGEAGT